MTRTAAPKSARILAVCAIVLSGLAFVLRKTLGMNLKNSGVDLGSIQEILGHSNPAVTSRYYAESTPDTLRSVRKRAIA